MLNLLWDISICFPSKLLSYIVFAMDYITLRLLKNIEKKFCIIHKSVLSTYVAHGPERKKQAVHWHHFKDLLGFLCEI